MYWESVLSSAIEVGIGIAGFSGIVAAINRRGQEEWTYLEHVRLYSLLGSSFASIFFAFLPFILLSAGMPLVLTWRISSAILGVLIMVVGVIRFSQFKRASPKMSQQESATFVCVGGFAALQIVNVAVIGADWPFLVGVLGSLAVAAAQFIRLLVKSAN